MNVVTSVGKERDTGAAIDVKHSIRRLWLWVLPLKAMQTILTRAEESGEHFDSNLEAMRTYFSSLPSPLYEDSSIGHLLTNTLLKSINF